MKKAIPLILLLSTLIFPVYYIICCISNNYLIIKIFVIWPVIIFFISLLFIIIKKIPFAVKLGISFVSVFISICLIFVNCAIFQPLEFQITTGDDIYVASISNEAFWDKTENYESAVTYSCYRASAILNRYTNTLIVKFHEDDFSEKLKEVNDNFEFFEYPVDGYGSPEFDYYGFSFRAYKHKRFPQVISFIGINHNTNEIAEVSASTPHGPNGTFEEIFLYDCFWEYVDAYRQGGIWNVQFKCLFG